MPDERVETDEESGGGTGRRYWPDLKSVAEVQAGGRAGEDAHADGVQKKPTRVLGRWVVSSRHDSSRGPAVPCPRG